MKELSTQQRTILTKNCGIDDTKDGDEVQVSVGVRGIKSALLSLQEKLKGGGMLLQNLQTQDALQSEGVKGENERKSSEVLCKKLTGRSAASLDRSRTSAARKDSFFRVLKEKHLLRRLPLLQIGDALWGYPSCLNPLKSETLQCTALGIGQEGLEWYVDQACLVNETICSSFSAGM